MSSIVQKLARPITFQPDMKLGALSKRLKSLWPDIEKKRIFFTNGFSFSYVKRTGKYEIQSFYIVVEKQSGWQKKDFAVSSSLYVRQQWLHGISQAGFADSDKSGIRLRKVS